MDWLRLMSIQYPEDIFKLPNYDERIANDPLFNLKVETRMNQLKARMADERRSMVDRLEARARARGEAPPPDLPDELFARPRR